MGAYVKYSGETDKGVCVGSSFPVSLYLGQPRIDRDVVTTIEFNPRNLRLVSPARNSLTFRFPKNIQFLQYDFTLRAIGSSNRQEWTITKGSGKGAYSAFIPASFSASVKYDNRRGPVEVYFPIAMVKNQPTPLPAGPGIAKRKLEHSI